MSSTPDFLNECCKCGSGTYEPIKISYQEQAFIYCSNCFRKLNPMKWINEVAHD